MRPKFRTVTMIAVAMLAMSVVGVASASAARPELLNRSGSPLLNEGFTANAAGPDGAKIEASSTVLCNSVTSKGEISGAKTVSKLIVEWHECESSGYSCWNIEKGHVLKSEPLQGTLVYLNKAEKTVGLVLEKEEQNTYEKLGIEKPLWAKYRCGGVAFSLRGHLIGKLTPVNSFTSSFTLSYESYDGVQTPDEYEGGPSNDQLVQSSNGIEDKFGLSSDETLTTEESARIEA